jgi:hypothetical protein
MKIHHVPRIISVLALAAFPALAQLETDGENLIENGKFEMVDSNGHPQGWTVSHPDYLRKCETTVEMLAEGDTTFYRVTKHAASSPELGSQEITIPPGTGSLLVKIKMRGSGIVRGAERWALPGIAVTYLFEGSEDGKPGSLDKWPVIPVGDSDWQEYEVIIPVRDNAPRASISIIGQGWTGTADFTDVEVEILE